MRFAVPRRSRAPGAGADMPRGRDGGAAASGGVDVIAGAARLGPANRVLGSIKGRARLSGVGAGKIRVSGNGGVREDVAALDIVNHQGERFSEARRARRRGGDQAEARPPDVGILHGCFFFLVVDRRAHGESPVAMRCVLTRIMAR